MQWFSSLTLPENWKLQAIVFIAIAVIAIIALTIAYRALFAHRLRLPGGGRARQSRLGLVDAFSLDGQRQLVLVRRDNVEHLVMIGGPNDVVVESQIIRVHAQPSAPPLRDKESAPVQSVAAPKIPTPIQPVPAVAPALAPAAASQTQPQPQIQPTISPVRPQPRPEPPNIAAQTRVAPKAPEVVARPVPLPPPRPIPAPPPPAAPAVVAHAPAPVTPAPAAVMPVPVPAPTPAAAVATAPPPNVVAAPSPAPAAAPSPQPPTKNSSLPPPIVVAVPPPAPPQPPKIVANASPTGPIAAAAPPAPPVQAKEPPAPKEAPKPAPPSKSEPFSDLDSLEAEMAKLLGRTN